MYRILIIGTGRAADHLGPALRAAGQQLVGIVGRNADKAEALARSLNTTAYAFGAPWPEADLHLLMVSDDAVHAVAAKVPPGKAVIAHISGTLPYFVLGDHAHRGVLWPVQSLSAGTSGDLRQVPLAINGEDELAKTVLGQVAASLSDKVMVLPFQQRRVVHLAAVLTSNLPVALFQAARELVSSHGLDPALLTPLWRTSTANAGRDPDHALTGPASRGDIGTMQAHLEGLSTDDDLRAAYTALSRSILRRYHPHLREEL